LKYFFSDTEVKITRCKLDEWSMVKTHEAVLADRILGYTMISPSSIPGHGETVNAHFISEH
jgi:hypothetical protein